MTIVLYSAGVARHQSVIWAIVLYSAGVARHQSVIWAIVLYSAGVARLDEISGTDIQMSFNLCGHFRSSLESGMFPTRQ